MTVKQCQCGGASIEVPAYYPGPIHCGALGCGGSALSSGYRPKLAKAMSDHFRVFASRSESYTPKK